MRLRSTYVMAMVVALHAGSTAAADKDGATLYQEKTCISCHGAEGRAPVLPVYPKLAGQNPDYLYQQLQDIKSESRKNAMTAAMTGIMQNVNDDEMRIIVDWLGSLQR